MARNKPGCFRFHLSSPSGEGGFSMKRVSRLLVGLLALSSSIAVARADDHEAKAAAMAAKSIAWLKAQQDSKTGGWGVPKEGPAYPAMTALVINGLLMEPGVDIKDAAVKSGVDFMLKYRQADGGIYDKILPSYNTSIVLSALAKVDTVSYTHLRAHE